QRHRRRFGVAREARRASGFIGFRDRHAARRRIEQERVVGADAVDLPDPGRAVQIGIEQRRDPRRVAIERAGRERDGERQRLRGDRDGRANEIRRDRDARVDRRVAGRIADVGAQRRRRRRSGGGRGARPAAPGGGGRGDREREPRRHHFVLYITRQTRPFM